MTSPLDQDSLIDEDVLPPQEGDSTTFSQELSKDYIQQLEREGEIAADYIEALLDIADFEGDIDMDIEGSRASVAIVGDDIDDLVGRDGVVLEALQELTRLAVHVKTGERSRLMLDVAGYRQAKRKALADLTEQTIQEVLKTGEPVEMQPMTPFERKVVHDVVAQSDLQSESEGVEPYRFVVVRPTNA